jgi:hypothetical protein
MPIKNQSDCYRTIKGVRWPNLCDVLEPSQENEVRARRDAGHRVRTIRHPDGYYQAFIHPDDLEQPTTTS